MFDLNALQTFNSLFVVLCISM